MIALVQPFNLQAPGGGARILRSFLKDAPAPFISVCTSLAPPASLDSEREVHLPLRPYLGQIEHTRLAYPLSLLTPLFARRFKRQLRELFVSHDVQAVHAIPHSMDFWYAFEVARSLNLPYILTVHDDLTYNHRDRAFLNRALDRLAIVWREADARMVISEAMGQAYNERYSQRPYSVVTDGLTSVPSTPRTRPENRLHVYFMGSIHLTYEPNFQTLLDALNRVATQRPELDVRLTIRGGLPFSLDTGPVPCDVLGWGTQDDIERDLETADLLYVPLPFDPAYDAFVRYSLSTKMVTYLGSGLPMLYHGPREAAAHQLLDAHDAAICSNTTESPVLAEHLTALHSSRLDQVAQNALRLARRQFMIDDQRRAFWSLVDSASLSNEQPIFA